jgi:hypothetical protein
MSYTLYISSEMDLKIKKAKNTMGKKYLSYIKAKAKVSSLGLKTRKEYIEYVQSNNIDSLPIHAQANYTNYGWVGFADYLGITDEEYKANKKAQWVDVVRNRKPSTKRIKRAKTSPVIASKPPVLQGLDPDKVIAFLIKEDVAPETIVNMVAELDIKSSTLMNDLCKYMQDRSKRQAEVWRPTGYNTAEAQMTIKI